MKGMMRNNVSKVFVLDTDHLSLYGRNHPKIVASLQEAQAPLQTTPKAISGKKLLSKLARQNDGAGYPFAIATETIHPADNHYSNKYVISRPWLGA